jgi:poly(hydroxyalkanoate) depolymerase family esterase
VRPAVWLLWGLLLGGAGCSHAPLPEHGPAARRAAGADVLHTERHGSADGLAYRLYLPEPRGAARVPLVVMLHGCQQDAAAFSAASRTLRHAGGVALLFPEQDPSAHPQRCWNWFSPAHQVRDAGEPAVLAALTRRIAAEHDIDRGRIYVAGISAGGLMASILAAAYPDVYSALGIHSAAAYPVAATVAEALAVMRGEGGGAEASAAAAVAAMGERLRGVPVVVVHGSADAVVRPINARRAAESWWQVYRRAAGLDGGAEARITRTSGTEGGRPYERVMYAATESGAPVVELWLVEGLGHAWSGGLHGGSFADHDGLDAARVILRFLLEQRP